MIMTGNKEVPRRCALQLIAGLAGVKTFLGEGVVGVANQMPPATLRRLVDIAWQPLESTFFPPGLKMKPVYTDKAKNTALSLVRYPKGYHEPRHYHKGCGHWIYLLSGRIRDTEQAHTPGTFVYAPPGNVHGPFTADEISDVLFFVDGPFDVFAA
jgi:quercetin dioxygenase-like cupin family protein